METWFDGSVRSVGDGPLHAGTISFIYKRLVRQAFEKKLLSAMSETELECWVAAVSSHSIRGGVAQDNFAAGESLPAIMQALSVARPRDDPALRRQVRCEERGLRAHGGAVSGKLKRTVGSNPTASTPLQRYRARTN